MVGDRLTEREFGLSVSLDHLCTPGHRPRPPVGQGVRGFAFAHSSSWRVTSPIRRQRYRMSFAAFEHSG